MLCQLYTSTNTAYFPSMPRNMAIELLLELVEESLHLFPEYLQTVDDYDATAGELILNSKFSHVFQLKVQERGCSGYSIHDESADQEDLIGKRKKKGIPPRVDIGILLAHSAERILLIEGKRLHDPHDKQYVSGKTGGITRFKTEQHGADVGTACMLGYVQNDTFPFWHSKINGWIDAETASSPTTFWGENDRLQVLSNKANHLAHCESTHTRTQLDVIRLHHFWVKVI